jgi:gas vesicle protein
MRARGRLLAKAGEIMFGFSRMPSKTNSELMRDELGESWLHLLQAANHAATGVGASVGPATGKVKTAAARGYTGTVAKLTPLAEAYKAGAQDAAAAVALKATRGAKKEPEMPGRRTGLLFGLLAGGIAVGAAGALVMRRRKQQQWAEYDPSEALESVRSESRSMVDKMSSKTDTALDKASQRASRVMERGADKLNDAASALREGKNQTKSTVDDLAEAVNDQTDEFSDRISSASRNGRM